MREVAERRQQLELEHEQALAILKFKQDEIKRLQRSKVRELEEKCRSQSEQFGLLSQELENFRLQASKVDLATSGLLNNPNLSVLTNGVGLTTERGMIWVHLVQWVPHCSYLPLHSKPTHLLKRTSKFHGTFLSDSYNPYDGPNDNPEVELPLTAGEYIYVYGDMDDDGFYEGELMDGQRGLVPSNFVDRVSDDDVMSTYHPETGDILAAAPSDQASAFAVPAPLTNGLDLDLEEVGVDIVPYPRKLTLIKQLAKSIIIGWDPPLVPAGWGNVWSYNVYVDQELRLNVPFGSQTKAVLERLDINLKAYRVSVQSLTEKGLSDQLCCSMLVGRDVCVAPTQLCVERVTATSANLSWLPSNSNYVHIVSLNEEECELVKAGCYSLCLNNLLPSLQYMVKLEARPHRTPWELPVERREHRSTTITFTTLMAGTPDAPLDVQLERGPSPGIALVSWLPVTIDAAGTSNGVRVTGYTIYADKKKVLEVSSPTAGSVLLGPSQIHSLQAAQALTVRTTSVHSESCDSLSVNVPSKLAAIMSGSAIGAPAVPALTCTPMSPSLVLSKRSSGNSAAKVSVLPSDTQITDNNIGGGLHSPSALVHNINLVSKTWQFVFLSSGNSESTKKKDDGEMRIFVALFPYDPVSMSPNPDAAEEELPFREGQIIKIHGDKDADGFYRGESGGRHGYVPCNMVSEIQVEDPETRQQLLQQGFLSTAASMEKLGVRSRKSGARRMVAIFDYDPRESSPNTDIEAELTFSAGDIIQVFGEMDDDGFFNGDLNGQKGLAPSNFLQALPDDQSVALKPAAEPKKESQVVRYAQLYKYIRFNCTIRAVK
uniref:RIMS-binding protein 2 n=1 Tax=Gouania willdenowi TaxID=441366 RepID=A0A8C5HDL4_GOUWI